FHAPLFIQLADAGRYDQGLDRSVDLLTEHPCSAPPPSRALRIRSSRPPDPGRRGLFRLVPEVLHGVEARGGVDVACALLRATDLPSAPPGAPSSPRAPPHLRRPGAEPRFTNGGSFGERADRVQFRDLADVPHL